MTINAICPHCGTQTQVHERFAGTSGPCRNCDQTMSVPAANGAEVDPTLLPTRTRTSSIDDKPLEEDQDPPLPFVFTIPGCLILVIMTVAVHLVALLLTSETGFLFFCSFYWIAFAAIALFSAARMWLINRDKADTDELRRQMISDQLGKRDTNGE